VLRHRKREALVDGYIEVPKNIFPEYYLIEVERFQDIIKSDLDEWIYFFKNSEIKEDFKAKNIQLVREKLDLLKMPESERKAYERYLMNKASERDVIETAKLDARIDVAKAMLAEGMQASLISKVTGLSEAEILELQSQLKK
jgi:predicted transposase/invertase (TIGR01784 family)